ncbi:MAG: hypothetical protein JXJ17_19495 [Anaerolineae bacterium]|nr:hypothetical protein [Anaerolineae bacterium]
MSDFNPSPHDRVTIGGLLYRVMPHPAVPTFAFGQEGRKAFVYQLSGGSDGGNYALKVFKVAFRLPELVDICDQLARFARWPGLEVCHRQCLNQDQHIDVLAQYPDMEYAVLMPWIGGSTWYDMVIGMTPLSRIEAATFSNATAQVLAAIEEAGLAHCDISAANVIINPTTGRAHLIDIEDLYAPDFNPPGALPAGTDGYDHKTASKGQWSADADRFAGAVIMSEMLAWHDSRIRKEADEEHYFGAGEMQEDCPRYRLMIAVLADLDPRLPELFEQVWFSSTLADCPPLKAWQEVISEVYHRERVAGVVSDWKPLVIPGGGLPDAAPQPMPEVMPISAPPQKPAPVEAVEDEPEPSIAKPDMIETTEPEPARPAPATPIIQPVIRDTTPPSSPAVQPIQVQPPYQSGGPVVEWRQLAVPQPSAQNGSAFKPISLPPAEPETPPDPIVVEEEEVPPLVESMPIAVEPQAEEVAFDGLGIEEPVEEEMPFDAIYDEPFSEEEEEAVPIDDELPIDEELPVVDETFEVEPYPDELMPVIESGLPQPVLDLHLIDEKNRPHLVWTPIEEATGYTLEEDDNPDFDSPKSYQVKGSSTEWTPPRLLWRRSGRLYYRVRAEAEDDIGPWSDTVAIRLGR